jgi:hypothetical protein
MPSLLLSPHTGNQVSAIEVDPPLQVNPVSIVHVLLHPSPFELFPSSQYVAIKLYLFASPQISVQVSGVEADHPVQKYPVSIWQLEFHPSPETVPPSSHPSVPTLLLSPQIGEQVSTEVELPPVQVNPNSTVQEFPHPSPLLPFPSSHISAPTLRPSPQVEVHTEGAPEQKNPGSIKHAPEQPSPDDPFPSSQVSPESITPFEHAE